MFVVGFHWGIRGGAAATVVSQYIAGIGILLYVVVSQSGRAAGETMKPQKSQQKGMLREGFDPVIMKEIITLSSLTCLQQSVMNFGILMVQGLVNSFGATTMAAFAAAVKIDTFAYLPVQDFGNAYSTFVAQNYGVKDYGRIQKGTKEAFAISIVFSIIISILVCTFAASLMEIFVKAQETAVIACGVQYLRIEGSFYCGIGCLFLLYGYYRNQQSTDVSGTYGDLSGAACCAGLYPFGAVESPGNLGGNCESQKFKRNLIRRQKIPCYNEPVRM